MPIQSQDMLLKAGLCKNDDLSRRINSFERWCYCRKVKIKWLVKISNEEVGLLQRIREKELCLYNSVKKQKMAFAGHVLRGSSGKDLLHVLEGKLNSKLSQGRPRRLWLDEIKSWTKLDSYEKIKNLANDRKSWSLQHYMSTFLQYTRCSRTYVL